MSREILFRGKRTDNGEWVKGDLLHSPDETIRIHNSVSFYTLDPSTVCQYTGLKDKNGKKIFDGDILKAIIEGSYPLPYHEIVTEVVLWDEHDKCFCIRKKGDKTLVPFSECIFDDVEIIGNIFDNPDLLEYADENTAQWANQDVLASAT